MKEAFDWSLTAKKKPYIWPGIISRQFGFVRTNEKKTATSMSQLIFGFIHCWPYEI